LRPSLAFGAAGFFPSKDGQLQADPEAAINVEASLELGPVFVAGTWFHGVGEKLPDRSFLGVKLGYMLGDWPLSPYASVGIGNLSQSALFRFDEGTTGSASGLAYELEIGAVLFRHAGIGRVWIYGLGLFPTFDVRSSFGPESASIRVLGFGLRFAL
jgi:hypothetical protein